MNIAILILVLLLIVISIKALVHSNRYQKLRYTALCGCKFVEDHEGQLKVKVNNGNLCSVSDAYEYASNPKQSNRFSRKITAPSSKDTEDYLAGSWREDT